MPPPLSATALDHAVASADEALPTPPAVRHRDGTRAVAAPRPLAQALSAPQRTSARSATTLAAATAKLVSKQTKAKSKAEAKIAALEASIAAKQAASAQNASDVVVDEELLALVEGFLDLAQQDLLDAQALPESTPVELAAKLEAIAQAELGVKLATKEVASANKAVTKHEKAIAKLDAQVVAAQAKLADQEAALAAAEQNLADLALPFDFDPGEDHAVGLLVTSGDAPVVGAEVQLVAALAKPGAKGSRPATVWFTGRTDVTGRVDTTVRLPDALEQLDVIIDAEGLSGDWTWPGHLERAGIFAPSKRVTIGVAALGDREFQLVEDT